MQGGGAGDGRRKFNLHVNADSFFCNMCIRDHVIFSFVKPRVQLACRAQDKIEPAIAHLKRYHYPIFSGMEVSSHDTSPLDVAIHRPNDKKISHRSEND